MLDLEYLQKVAKSKELQDLEWWQCHDDPYYFLTNWAYTLDVHDRETPIKTFPDKEYLKMLVAIWVNNNLLLVPKSRQMQMSWLFTSLYLWDTQFYAGRLTFFQSKKSEDADDLVKRAKFVYDHEANFLKRYNVDGEFYPLHVNPQHNGKHTENRMTFPEINSEIRGIPEGGDIIRMHTASGILCLDGKTKILTKDLHWINVEDAKIGTELVGFDEDTGSLGKRLDGNDITRQYKNTKIDLIEEIIRPCYRLKFSDNTEIICSEDHKWLAGFGQRRKWMTTKKLRVQNGQRAGSLVVKLVDKSEEQKDYDAGYLAAAFDGEGCLEQNKYFNSRGYCSTVRLSVCQNENAMCNKIRELLIKYKFNYTEEIFKKNYSKLHHVFRIGNRHEVIRLLSMFRPKRLLDKINFDLWGSAKPLCGVKLIEKEYIGNRKVIAIRTESKTFIAEGLASHNSDEMAFQPEAKAAYTAAKPTISSKGRFTGVSTAEDGTFFEDMVFDKLDVA
jgi:hypothetical protein